jgi:2-dehydro-3-deoxy-D-arabinonate dehydratase
LSFENLPYLFQKNTMKLYKTTTGIVIEVNHQFYKSKHQDWDIFINRDDLFEAISAEVAGMDYSENIDWFAQKVILAPIQSQEIWAAGVTYLRSRNARMEESKESGGDTFYDKVYDAERPEIFFKATAQRTVGTDDFVRIRKDSTWDVPEPELTLCITSSGKTVGYTIGNDMSSRSIEGENPLYLPQAKSYDKCAGLGPCVYVSAEPISPETIINMKINRNEKTVFDDQVAISQMKRKHQELVDFLYRECSFPSGCFLMTGTCIVPDFPFTLQKNDEILITIDNIGTLRNIVE